MVVCTVVAENLPLNKQTKKIYILYHIEKAKHRSCQYNMNLKSHSKVKFSELSHHLHNLVHISIVFSGTIFNFHLKAVQNFDIET